MKVDVAIVGAGPVGLTAATLLGRLGVTTLVIERNESTSQHPRGHVVNARSMEIFRTIGLADAITEEGLPTARNQGVVFLRRVVEPEIAVLLTAGDPQRYQQHRLASPSEKVSCPQDRLEPILLAAAQRDPNIQLCFSTELRTLAGSGHGVRFNCEGPDGPWRGTARFLIGADGARSTVRELAAIGMSGQGRIGRQIGIYFEADLWPLIEHRPYLLWWIFNARTCGVMISLDGRRRWTYNFAFDPATESVEDFTPERCLSIIHDVLGTDTIDVAIRSILPWRMQARLADHYRVGPVFLAGDAAHPLPPTGGQGMNTGVGDVHNLAWKMALVLQGRAPDTLLDTYDQERRPVGRFNIEQSVANAMKMADLGLSGMATADSSIARRLEGPEREAAEAHIREVVPSLREHFDYIGQTFGHAYTRGALVDDGLEPASLSVVDYHPTARPGHRAPHLWLGQDGEAVSTIDLIGFGKFVLFATPEYRDWCQVCIELSHADGLAASAWTIGQGGDLADPDGGFRELYGLPTGGVVLVRPDGHVGYRSTGSEPPEQALRTAMDRILGRVPAPSEADPMPVPVLV